LRIYIFTLPGHRPTTFWGIDLPLLGHKPTTYWGIDLPLPQKLSTFLIIFLRAISLLLVDHGPLLKGSTLEIVWSYWGIDLPSG